MIIILIKSWYNGTNDGWNIYYRIIISNMSRHLLLKAQFVKKLGEELVLEE